MSDTNFYQPVFGTHWTGHAGDDIERLDVIQDLNTDTVTDGFVPGDMEAAIMNALKHDLIVCYLEPTGERWSVTVFESEDQALEAIDKMKSLDDENAIGFYFDPNTDKPVDGEEVDGRAIGYAGSISVFPDRLARLHKAIDDYEARNAGEFITETPEQFLLIEQNAPDESYEFSLHRSLAAAGEYSADTDVVFEPIVVLDLDSGQFWQPKIVVTFNEPAGDDDGRYVGVTA